MFQNESSSSDNSSQQFPFSTIKFNPYGDKFSQNLLNKLNNFRHQQVHCDLTIMCKNDEIVKCHQNIVQSELELENSGRMKHKSPGNYILLLGEWKASPVRKLVEYCYTGCINFEINDAVDVAKLCNLLKSRTLKTLAQDFLAKNLTQLYPDQISKLDSQMLDFAIRSEHMQFVPFTKVLHQWIKTNATSSKHEKYLCLMEQLQEAEVANEMQKRKQNKNKRKKVEKIPQLKLPEQKLKEETRKNKEENKEREEREEREMLTCIYCNTYNRIWENTCASQRYCATCDRYN